ncbi:unnamed protein product [Protopolystoma xenopodis]|uniref:Uncharacterized protein n=1 Tax=Protopolystoma xenopodis TaxID=117903 RepID=A0A3S5BD13_9PLAT|nr:unnamed protein product [Protopolystoma xenopodis]
MHLRFDLKFSLAKVQTTPPAAAVKASSIRNRSMPEPNSRHLFRQFGLIDRTCPCFGLGALGSVKDATQPLGSHVFRPFSHSPC